MAKIAFTKLGLTKNDEVVIVDWNGQSIEVKQYLPIQDKATLISNVLNYCQDGDNFINEVKFALYFTLEVIYHYTNINFTEKQKEDSNKLYDLLVGSGLWAAVKEAIPEKEGIQIADWAHEIAQNIFSYRNSIYGILDAMNTDYKDLEFDATAIKDKLSDPEALGLLKDVMSKLG